MLINSPNISGSLTVTGNSVITGSLTVLGGINGAITGSATTASYVEYNNVANKPTLVSGSSQISFNGITDKPTLVSGSSQITYSGLTGIPSGIVSGSAQVAAFGYATTGSNTFIGNQTITGSILGSGSLTIDGCITATGQIVAQTINVQQVTSSIVYSCGSNIFGTSLSNTQQFTGSMFITGSNLNANVGNACFQGSVCASSLVVNKSNPILYINAGNNEVSTIGFTQAAVVGYGGFIKVSTGLGDRAMTFGLSAAGTNNDATEVVRIDDSGVTCFLGAVCAPVGIFSGPVLAGGAVNIDSSLAVQISSDGSGTQKWFGVNKNGTYGLIVGYSETTGLSGIGAYIRQVTSDPLHFVVNNTTTALSIYSTGIACFATTVCAPTFVLANGNCITALRSTGGAVIGVLGFSSGSDTLNIKGGNSGGALSIRFEDTANPMGGFYNSNFGVGTLAAAYRIDAFCCSSATNTVTPVLRLAHVTSGTATTGLGAGISFFSQRPSGAVNLERAAIYGISGTNPDDDGDLAFYTRTDTGAIGVSEKMRITSDGNIGIGTTNPAATLHLCTINTTSVVRVESACDQAGLRIIAGVPGTSRASRIDFLNGATCVGRPQWTIINDYNQNGTNDLSFVNCDPTTRVVTITQGGNVGIGVTGPTFRLDVQNNTQAIARILDTSTNSSLVLQAGTGSGMKVTGYNYTTSTAVPLYISVDGANTIMQSGGGNVGINTTSPSAKLDINYSPGNETGVRLVGGAGACCGNMFRSYIGEYSDTSPINLFWANHGNPARTNTLVRIHTNETAAGGYPLRITAQGSLCSPTYEALAVNHVGAVTIGTSCAAFGRPLTVCNDIVAYFSNQESITMGLSAGTGVQSWGIQVCDTGDGGSALHLNARGGNVGINKGSGNSASYPLDVTGIVASSTGFLVNSGAYNSISEVPYTGMYMTAAGSSDGFGALLISSRTDIARPIIFGTSNGSVSTERVRITPGGNVGIGTNCPSVTLDINGSVRFRGDIYTQFEYIASGNFTNGTYYNIVGVNLISTGIYILEGYVDTYSAGGGTYFMRFASVPFYFWDVGSNSISFVDLPPVLGTGHHLGDPFPLFRLQQTLAGAGIYLQFNPNATWSGMDNSSGKTFQVRLKRIGA